VNLAREKTIVVRDVGYDHSGPLLRHTACPLFAAHVLTPTAVDAAIPFVPLFVVPIISVLSARPVSVVGD